MWPGGISSPVAESSLGFIKLLDLMSVDNIVVRYNSIEIRRARGLLAWALGRDSLGG